MVNKDKNLHEMNNHELLEFMIDFCREISMRLNTVTTGNLSHRIGNIQHGLITCAYSVEKTMKKNDSQQNTIEPPSFEESMGEKQK